MKVKDILIRWLKNQAGDFCQSQIETELPKYGEFVFGIQHSPGTYSRVFREMLEQKVMFNEGYDVEDVSYLYPHKKGKYYRMVSIFETV